MKHLNRFNEHSHEVSTIINDCKDILIDLSDNNITCKVWVSGSGSIIVDIGDDVKFTSLMNMSDTFEHLISYLESFGYLFSKKSFWQGDSWGYYESCPKCFSDEVTIDVNSEDKFQSGHKFTCDKCKYLGDSEDFQSAEWPLNKSELFYSIKNGVRFYFMRIQFEKSKITIK